MTWTRRLLAVALAVILSTGASAQVVGYGVPGKVTIIKPGRLIKFVARGSFTLPDPLADDPRSEGGSLSFTGTGERFYPLSAGCWTGLGPGGDGSTGFKCRDTMCRSVLVRTNLIKAVCRPDTGTFTVPETRPVNIVLGIGDGTRYCATCGGTPRGNPYSVFKRTDCTPPTACPPVELLVPAYGNPCCGGGPTMWSTLIAAAQANTVPLSVILNPASGPGAGTEIDPNYVNDTGSGPMGPMVDLKAAGGIVYGYVTTSYATRTLAAVEAEVDKYYDPAFWRGAGVLVDGIFLDEMSSDLPNVGYYQQLRDYVHAKDPSARVIANPGVTATQDTSGGTSGFTVQDYANAADVLVVFENTGSEYRTNYSAPAWVNTLTARHFAHLVHSESATADMTLDVGLAKSRNAGMLYVTDDVLSPNPWDTLATYWSSEVSQLSLP